MRTRESIEEELLELREEVRKTQTIKAHARTLADAASKVTPGTGEVKDYMALRDAVEAFKKFDK
jgi:hypothetical protein